MKKIMNNVDAVENEMVLGMVKAYPQYIKKLDCGNVVVRARKKEGKVALISGGGSGHEPAHSGFVGEVCWMLPLRDRSLLLRHRIRFMKVSKR